MWINIQNKLLRSNNNRKYEDEGFNKKNVSTTSAGPRYFIEYVTDSDQIQKDLEDFSYVDSKVFLNESMYENDKFSLLATVVNEDSNGDGDAEPCHRDSWYSVCSVWRKNNNYKPEKHDI